MTIAELAARYSITEASTKARVQFLNLDPSAITATDLDQLDALADHLEQGNKIASFSFTPSAAVEVMTTTSELATPTPVREEAALTEYAPMAMPSTMEHLEKIYTFLQKASDSDWHLPTSVIRSITGATPRGKRWKRYGFVFEPATRHGGERAWAVSQAEWDFPVE